MAEVSSLVQSITNGKVEASSSYKDTSTMGSDAVGKDQFLQLLVTQMQNQNPLEPSSDTEWISQLSSFSSLEAMENMGDTMTKMQNLNMVGKYVDIEFKSSTGNVTKESGYVDYVNVSGDKVQISVNGVMYDAADVKSVYDDYYLLDSGMLEGTTNGSSGNTNGSGSGSTNGTTNENTNQTGRNTSTN